MKNWITFKVDSRYAPDLEDDFIMNETETLYEFIGKDPVKAFYLGYYIQDWFGYLDKKQKYLYSKLVRHNKDDLEKYLPQIDFWTKKFKPSSEEVDMVELAEYIINNMFWEEKTEDLDRVKLAFFFGDTIATKKKEDEKESDSVH